ncbi:MAG: leucine-rich repeat domain-containing protein, partial [Bacteroidales bacterium]|nr:leucine-rich repeat domain-containing protein [Bacteroidales bacterium]
VCTSLTSVTIGNGVTTIGNGAFKDCKSLKEFKGKFAAVGGRCLIVDGVLNAFALGCGATQYTIPDSVTTIGERAFSFCTSLTSVTIPDSVTTIGEGAFYGCSSLTSVTIGKSVSEIGKEAFKGCNIDTIVCYPKIPPKTNDSFDRFENLIIPTGCEEAYANSDWGQYLK